MSNTKNKLLLKHNGRFMVLHDHALVVNPNGEVTGSVSSAKEGLLWLRETKTSREYTGSIENFDMLEASLLDFIQKQETGKGFDDE